ncbi:hypothetical protein LEP1GSC041_1640 [Leptospira noguchii str. 2006001870]|nr:hypothetical protein LEP1GSC041_1640 [Leptospira noguchii str. 2006001870]
MNPSEKEAGFFRELSGHQALKRKDCSYVFYTRDSETLHRLF